MVISDNIFKIIRKSNVVCMIKSGIAELIHTIINLFRISLYIKIIKNCGFSLFDLHLQIIQNKSIKSYIFRRMLQLDKT